MRTAFYSLALTCTALGSALAAQQLPEAPAPNENPMSAAKAVLGKALFWEEQLSSDNSMACGTCHRPAQGGADPRFRRHPGADGKLLTNDDVFGSPGVPRLATDRSPLPDELFDLRPRVSVRASLSVLTAQYADELFWDGRAGGEFADPLSGEVQIASGGALENQALMPLLNTTEMAHDGRTWQDVTEKLASVRPLALASELPVDLRRAIRSQPSYPKLFDSAFGDEEITPVRIAFAIASYERTLVPDQTPYDRYIAGDRRAMTRNQIRGLANFERARCGECHIPPLFTDNEFRNIGVRPARDDGGRQDVTTAFEDSGKFKVPSLRNVGLRPRFMHTGEMRSLDEVLRHYRRPRSPNLDPIVQGGLRVGRRRGGRGGNGLAPIIDFLQNALTDPRVAAESKPFDRPVLRSERDG